MNYLKSSLLLTVLIFVQLGSSVSYAKTNAISISSGGIVTNIVLPESLCDISDNYEGQILFDFLTKAKARDKSSIIPEALGIIGKCNAYESILYPWGYIAFLPNEKYTNTQIKYNKFIEEFLDSHQDEFSELMGKVLEDMDISSMFKDNYGVDLEKFEMGKFKVIKATDNAIHLLIINSFELNGVQNKEVATVSQQVMGDRVLSIYLYHEMDNITEALRKVDSMDEALKVTKIIN